MLHFSEDQCLSWMDSLAEKDFVIIDNFLDDSTLELVLNDFHFRLPNFDVAGIGALNQNMIVEGIRNDETFWLDMHRDEHLSPFFNYVQETIQLLNQYCFLSLAGSEFHYAHYPDGSFYKRHLDQFRDRSNRMISMIVYLNRDWKSGDGGELKIYRDDGDKLVAPLLNRCVLFKSDSVEHEVLLSKSSRKSVTGWLLYQPNDLGYLLT